MAPRAGCTEGSQSWACTPKHKPCSHPTRKSSWPQLGRGGRLLSPTSLPLSSSQSKPRARGRVILRGGLLGGGCHLLSKPLPPGASPAPAPRNRSLLPCWAQQKGERDGFKFPAHPDPFLSSSTPWFSTCATKRTSLPLSTATRRAPASPRPSVISPHSAWIHSQKSQRSWATTGEVPPLCSAAHPRIYIPLPWSHQAATSQSAPGPQSLPQ